MQLAPIPRRAQQNEAVAEFLELDWLNDSDKPEGFDYAFWQSPDGIEKFVREVIQWDTADPDEKPAPYQIEILRDLIQYHRMAVRGPHGLGKSALASWAILFFLFAFKEDVKVVTTASVWRQLERFLWPELHKWSSRIQWETWGMKMREDKELLKLNIKLPHDKYAFAVASDKPEFIEGAHAKIILYIFDESKTIPAETFDAAEGAFSAGDAYALAMSTPGEPAGRFYEIHRHAAGFEDWRTRHVTLEEAMAAGRIRKDWVEARRRQWERKYPQMWHNRVLGEFYASAPDSVIPLLWVEQSIERNNALRESGEMQKEWDVNPAYGLDVADGGDDNSQLCRINARMMFWMKEFDTDVMSLVGAIQPHIDKLNPIGVDALGVGAGTFHRLRELGYKAVSVKVSERAVMGEKPLTDRSGQLKFLNLRSWLWWRAREMLEPAPDGTDSGYNGTEHFALCDNDTLTGDLTAPKFTLRSDGTIVVESKDETKARLGRSPDAADSWLAGIYARFFKKSMQFW